MRLYSERKEATQITQGISVTRTKFGDFWRFRIASFIWHWYTPGTVE